MDSMDSMSWQEAWAEASHALVRTRNYRGAMLKNVALRASGFGSGEARDERLRLLLIFQSLLRLQIDWRRNNHL